MVPPSDTVLTQLRKGVVEYCVLACLREKPAYGLELVERLGARGTLLTSDGTLYPLLSRMRKQGWVTTVLEASPLGPPRRYYQITAEGHFALGVFAETWARFSADVDATLEAT
jgi:PadR family transcriptional regulator, regulatory protein PadR